MPSLAILFFVIAIMVISFNIPGVVVSAASISGTLLLILLIFLVVSKIMSRFRSLVPYGTEKNEGRDA